MVLSNLSIKCRTLITFAYEIQNTHIFGALEFLSYANKKHFILK